MTYLLHEEAYFSIAKFLRSFCIAFQQHLDRWELRGHVLLSYTFSLYAEREE